MPTSSLQLTFSLATPRNWALCKAATMLLLVVFLLSSCTPRISHHDPQQLTPSRPLILIDPGHGGKDSGAWNRRAHLCEKQLCLTTARLLEQQLKQRGYPTLLLRSRDQTLSLSRRVEIANRHPESLLVSIHFNSASNSAAQGIEVYYHPGPPVTAREQRSKRLAHSLLQGALSSTRAASRGVKVASFRIIRHTLMPSCLIEGGFISHPGEARRLARSSYLHALAEGIAKGLDSYWANSANR